ncbi:MAG: cation transporter [Candidatus Heimdallarchaeota archaeon]|nr:cation transporter [Candidatus Heimdallarchaeota archaeon]MCK4877787.1 cation transporter [Candidatus Heimdallarchaeota archaeon]
MVSISLTAIANIISIGGNALLVVLKLVIGFLFNSISLIADGFDSILDLVTAGFAGIGERISKKPADPSHPFGHHKYQFVFSLAIALTLFVSSYFIASESIGRLRERIPLTLNYLILAAAIISFFGKIIMSLVLVRIGKKINSPVIIANAKNYRTDAFASVFVSIAFVGAIFDVWWLDPVCAFIIVALILYTGFDIVKISLPELLDRGPSEEIVDKLKKIALIPEEVKEVHIIRLRSILGTYTGDFHILVDPKLSILKAHEISEGVKEQLEATGLFKDLIIHIEPFTPEERLEGE